MAGTRRVGTFTLGIVLFLAGILLLLHLFVPAINYVFIFHLWPCIFIILGIEILVSVILRKAEAFKYDFAAIIIVTMMVVFTMGMAVVDYVITHEELWRII